MRLLHIWYLIIIVLIFTACKKELSREGGSANVSRQCISCDYLPVCDSSVFVYVDSSSFGIDTAEATIYILGDTVLQGIKYNAITPFAGFDDGLLYHCNNGIYQSAVVLSELGINIDSIKKALLQGVSTPIPITPESIQIRNQSTITLLKTNVPVNTTWTDTLFTIKPLPFITIAAVWKSQLLAKDAKHTVLGKTYSNVMHVKSKPDLTIPGLPLPLNLEMEYYFAKDIGIIESKATTPDGIVSSRLYSYKLK
jgi:hypothetical protein